MPSVDDLHNDSAHVPRDYGEDELPLSDGPDSVEDAVDEDRVPVEGAKDRCQERQWKDWIGPRREYSMTPLFVRYCSDPPSYANMRLAGLHDQPPSGWRWLRVFRGSVGIRGR